MDYPVLVRTSKPLVKNPQPALTRVCEKAGYVLISQFGRMPRVIQEKR